MAQAVVCIVMGSANDWPIMQGAAEMLARFHIPYEVTVSSAHRAPQRTAALAHEAVQRGVQVLIAGAGGAAPCPASSLRRPHCRSSACRLILPRYKG